MNYLDFIDQIAPAWHAKAACHPDNGHDPELWHPKSPPGRPNERPARRVVTEPAIAICRKCPVRQKCLAEARKNGETHGIWGGVDFERKAASDAA